MWLCMKFKVFKSPRCSGNEVSIKRMSEQDRKIERLVWRIEKIEEIVGKIKQKLEASSL